MTAPLCLHCRKRPVTRCGKYERPPKRRPARLIDGVRWRWFCSKSCCGKTNGLLPNSQAARLGSSKASSARAATARLKRLKAACVGLVDAEGRVHLDVLLPAVERLERYAYRRGWEACQQRNRWVA